MAGPYWHMVIASQLVHRLMAVQGDRQPGKTLNERPLLVAFGAIAPDIHFFPGGDKRISDLAHNTRPADLARKMIRIARTDDEKAFAYGWMLHVVTDITTHDLVNRYTAERFGRGTPSRIQFSDNQLGHYRIEWGLDLTVLKTPALSRLIPDWETIFAHADTVFQLVRKTFGEAHGLSIARDDWLSGCQGMLRYNLLFRSAWRATGQIDPGYFPVWLLKRLFYYSVFFPVIRLLAINRSLTEAGVFIPAKPPADGLERINRYTAQTVERFIAELGTGFKNLVVDNLEGGDGSPGQ